MCIGIGAREREVNKKASVEVAKQTNSTLYLDDNVADYVNPNALGS